ncbi:DDB1- and CUL4-associated factor 11 isoform X2 [Diachasma alloeum]|uniref:DDB1- and CUL4-associated factor 11 isoform X2 n=1 Tax=Diachasma alloeum TaxID=454923 RepID=UPI0007382798|nr:DDB1- and CUL4-associated factor 11 isoform X2 [Diachasma alloeum]
MDLRQHPDLISTLRLFIQRGSWGTSRGDNDSSDDEIIISETMPKNMAFCSTEQLTKNDICFETKLASGLVQTEEKDVNQCVTSIIQRSQLGPGFTTGQIRRIGNHFLPNTMKKVDKYNSKAFCGTYSKNGDLLVTASQDNYLRFYHTRSGVYKLFKKLNAQNVSWSILDTAFSPDGNYIAYSSWSDSLYLCPIYGDSNIQEALPLAPSDTGRFCIFSLVFSSDGREILGAANDGCLYVYDRECHQCAIKIEGHAEDANTVAFADSTSQILYSGGDDGLCKVWDRRTLNEANPHPVGILAGHTDGITYVDPRGDGRYLITNSKDQTIKLWDVRVFSSAEAVDNTRRAVANQNWDYRWQRVPKKFYTANKGKLEGDTSVMTYRGHMVVQTLVRCHFSPPVTTGQRYIYSGCGTGKVIIYDLLTGSIVRTLEGHKGCVRDVSWHPYRHEIISSSWDGVIGAWKYLTNDSELHDEWAEGYYQQKNKQSNRRNT